LTNQDTSDPEVQRAALAIRHKLRTLGEADGPARRYFRHNLRSQIDREYFELLLKLSSAPPPPASRRRYRRFFLAVCLVAVSAVLLLLVVLGGAMAWKIWLWFQTHELVVDNVKQYGVSHRPRPVMPSRTQVRRTTTRSTTRIRKAEL